MSPMKRNLFIPIILGTSREGRMSEHAAQYLYDYIAKNKLCKTQFVDPRNLNLPHDIDGHALAEKNPAYRDMVVRADGIIIVSPEYNHGYPGTLKRVLDMVLKEYIHKAVAICAVSAGGFGGARVTEQLTQVVRELGLTVTFTDLNVSKVSTVFNEKGELLDDRFPERVNKFLTELFWMAETLKYGRQNVPSQYHQQ